MAPERTLPVQQRRVFERLVCSGQRCIVLSSYSNNPLHEDPQDNIKSQIQTIIHVLIFLLRCNVLFCPVLSTFAS